MSIQVALTHRTTYRYDRPVIVSPQTIRLRPAPHTRTPILAYTLTIEPKDHFLNWQQDPQGNFLARAVFPNRVRTLAITVDLIADMAVINPFDFFLQQDAETWPFAYDTVLDQELAPYLRYDATLLGRYLRTCWPSLAPPPRWTRRRAPSTRSWRSTAWYSRGSPTSCGSNPASGRPSTRSMRPAARAGTAPGCSCTCSGHSAAPRGSARAT